MSWSDRKRRNIGSRSRSRTIRPRFRSISCSIFIGNRSIPTQADGQFTDIGPSYRAAIFFGNDEEKKIAEASKEKLARSGKFDKPIVTEILPAMKFYPAEAYHQKYYQQNPEHFEAFETGIGAHLVPEEEVGQARIMRGCARGAIRRLVFVQLRLVRFDKFGATD